MKKYFLVFGLFVFVASGCQKTNPVQTPVKQISSPKTEKPAPNNSSQPQAQPANLDKACLDNPSFSEIALQDYDINDPKSDQMLKKINVTLEPSCVILKSVRSEIPEMQSQANATLGRWQTGAGYFFDVRLRPDYSTMGIFYRFDTSDGYFKKLETISALTSQAPHLSSYSTCMSTSGQVAFAPNRKNENGNNRDLYLLDLSTDSYKKVVTLPSNESLNAGTYEKPTFDIGCRAGNSFRYAVYETNNAGQKSLKTYRDWSIK